MQTELVVFNLHVAVAKSGLYNDESRCSDLDRNLKRALAEGNEYIKENGSSL